MPSPDICIAGAGIIGLSLALSLERRGFSVSVLEAGTPLSEASQAAAGMLAVDDPENPAALLPLASLSRSLYPSFLDSLQGATQLKLSFQTHRTLQGVASAKHKTRVQLHPELQAILSSPAARALSFHELAEQSIDPRELASALLARVSQSRVTIRSATPVLSVSETSSSVLVETAHGQLNADRFVDCTGAWALSAKHVPHIRISPRKGQMLTVATPPALGSGLVLRTPEVYLVPRLHGPHAGQTVIGATVEDVGFDRTVNPEHLAGLLHQAAALLPQLRNAPFLTSWSGLRPATSDLLPLLGALPDCRRQFIAAGHYRNGILLAPGTAEVMAQLLTGEPLDVSLSAFSPDCAATAAAS